MASFRKEILGQIERIDTGRIFRFRDLSFETEKTANVAVLLSEQSRKGVLVRVGKAFSPDSAYRKNGSSYSYCRSSYFR